jgi:hypothetical protein
MVILNIQIFQVFPKINIFLDTGSDIGVIHWRFHLHIMHKNDSCTQNTPEHPVHRLSLDYEKIHIKAY